MRTACILYYLARTYNLHVITWREPGAADPRHAFPPDIKVDVIDLPCHNKSTPARALRNLTRAARGIPPLIDRFSSFEAQLMALLRPPYDVAVIEHFWAAAYASTLRPHTHRLVLDLHNIESILLDRCAASEPPPMPTLFRHWAACCRRLEAKTLPLFDLVLVASEADAAQIRVPAVVVPNTIPAVPRPNPSNRRPNEIVFSGNMEYHPNLAAVRWFLNDIWPILRNNTERGLTCRFLGKNEHTVRGLTAADPSLSVTGPVPDAVCALAESAAAIVPLLSGSGTRIKIIEAWAAGLPVISTTIGAEGLPAHPGEDLLIADTPAAFAAAVVNVMQHPDLASRLGARGRRLYERELTWESAWKTLSRAGL